MKKDEVSISSKEFFSNPKITENYTLLQNLEVFTYIESKEQEITNLKTLFAIVLDIASRNTINEIIDTTVLQISDRYLPSVITFIWKPLQNMEDIAVKCFKNYKLIDINLQVESINVFESFFQKHPEPVSFKQLCSEINNDSVLKPFYLAEPDLVIPILGISGLYGMALLGRNILGDEYSEKEILFLQNIMSLVSKSIQNHLDYEQTLGDLKTGLYNSGFFMDRLNQEIIRAKHSQTETSIIIIDIDRFKGFNETNGQLAGDRVLKTLAIILKKGIRAGDVPSRFGEEKFAILLPETGKDLAWTVAERLRNMAETMKVTGEPPLPQVTISLGVFTFNKATNITEDEAIRRADEALFMSKEMGRNRTTAWGSGLLSRIQHLEAESKQKNKALA
jgi:diguanylate cyclase (GGDEF)-like protein